MSKFFHIDVSDDDDAMSYAAICEQNMDKFGTSIEANEKFLAMCRGEMSREA